ncbi:hypothetical protein J2S55_003189 [Streptosporangium brasiliense]|uniref:Uncharacterized protein n=1 Tax=Streptosporangium brasiliense TaxID=47480 RepID=A0ABT9R3W1_9ACTN|nr:hypothetical protein [Streptosporangium brasiliense]
MSGHLVAVAGIVACFAVMDLFHRAIKRDERWTSKEARQAKAAGKALKAQQAREAWRSRGTGTSGPFG